MAELLIPNVSREHITFASSRQSVTLLIQHKNPEDLNFQELSYKM